MKRPAAAARLSSKCKAASANSASQPAADRDALPGSASQPAFGLSGAAEEVLKHIRKLGRLPKRRKNPKTSTANIASQPAADRDALSSSASQPAIGLPGAAEEVLKNIRKLGRLPKRRYNPKTDDDRNENNMAKRFDWHSASFSADTRRELEQLGRMPDSVGASAETPSPKASTRKTSASPAAVVQVVADIQQFGRLLKRILNAETQAEIKEANLARRLYDVRKLIDDATWRDLQQLK